MDRVVTIGYSHGVEQFIHIPFRSLSNKRTFSLLPLKQSGENLKHIIEELADSDLQVLQIKHLKLETPCFKVFIPLLANKKFETLILYQHQFDIDKIGLDTFEPLLLTKIIWLPPRVYESDQLEKVIPSLKGKQELLFHVIYAHRDIMTQMYSSQISKFNNELSLIDSEGEKSLSMQWFSRVYYSLVKMEKNELAKNWKDLCFQIQGKYP